MIQNILEYRYKLIQLPIMHTINYRHSVIVDVDNVFQEGHGALISQGGPDRSMVQVLSPSILNFLENHHKKLSEGYYFSDRGRLESFSKYPTPENGGSVAVTHGVRIEAVSQYI